MFLTVLKWLLQCCKPLILVIITYNYYDNVSIVDWEYFGVTKVTWAKCSMSFNFVNLAGTQNLFNSGYFIAQSFSALRAHV